VGEKRDVYRILVGKPLGKRQLWVSWCRWENNITVDHQKLVFGVMDWIELAQDSDSWWALVNAVMDLRVPQNAGKFLTS
jgi:hypothetical protein